MPVPLDRGKEKRKRNSQARSSLLFGLSLSYNCDLKWVFSEVKVISVGKETLLLFSKVKVISVGKKPLLLFSEVKVISVEKELLLFF
jgi:hypothetical protein